MPCKVSQYRKFGIWTDRWPDIDSLHNEKWQSSSILKYKFPVVCLLMLVYLCLESTIMLLVLVKIFLTLKVPIIEFPALLCSQFSIIRLSILGRQEYCKDNSNYCWEKLEYYRDHSHPFISWLMFSSSWMRKASPLYRKSVLSWINLLTGTEKIHHLHNFLKLWTFWFRNASNFRGCPKQMLKTNILGSFGTDFHQKRP